MARRVEGSISTAYISWSSRDAGTFARFARCVALNQTLALGGCASPREPSLAEEPSRGELADDPSRGEAASPAPSAVARRVSIADLPGLTKPATSTPTTAELGPRSRASEGRTRANGIEVRTVCGDSYCIDGIRDIVSNETFLPARLSADDRTIAGAGWLERVVRITLADDAHVSAYVAESSLSGGAHANNVLACATFDRKSRRRIGLKDVLPQARHGAKKLQSLFAEPVKAFNLLGATLDGERFVVRETGILLGVKGEVIVCAQGPYPSQSGSVIELSVGRIPSAYLLD